MAFCSKCGTQLVAGARFCPTCGAQQNAPSAAPTPGTYQAPYQNPYQAPYQAPQMYPEQMDISQNKGIACCSYLGILVLIPLLSRKNSRFAQFHARQGVTLLAGNILLSILSFLANLLTVTKTRYYYGFVPYEYEAPSTVLTVITALLGLFITVMAIIGIVNCCQGKAKKLPLIGGIDILKLFGK